MKRKLIQMGGKTMVVSLPSSWVKKYGLKKGEEINLEEEGNKIIFSTTKPFAVEETTLDIKEYDRRLVKRYIDILYIEGYEKIKIRYDDVRILDEIKEKIKELIGCSVMEAENNTCTIKILATVIESEFGSVLRRIFLILLSNSKHLREYSQRRDGKILEFLLESEKEINKLSAFCKRVLNTKGYKNHKNSFIYSIIEQLEHIADSYRDIAQYYIKKSKVKFSKETIELVVKLSQLYEEFYNLYYKYDFEKSFHFSKNTDKLFELNRRLINNSKNDDKYIVTYSYIILMKLYEIKSSFLALVI